MEPLILLSWDTSPILMDKITYELPPIESEEPVNAKEWAVGYGKYITMTDYMLKNYKPSGWRFLNAVEGVKVNLDDVDNKQDVVDDFIIPAVTAITQEHLNPHTYNGHQAEAYKRMSERFNAEYAEDAIRDLFASNEELARTIVSAWSVISGKSDTVPNLVKDLSILRRGEGKGKYYLEDIYSYIKNMQRSHHRADALSERIKLEQGKAENWQREADTHKATIETLVEKNRALEDKNREVGRLQDVTDAQADQIDNLEKIKENQEATISRLHAEIAGLKEEIYTQKAKTKAAVDMMKELRNAQKNEEATQEERTSKLQADKARLQAEIAALQEFTSTQRDMLTKVENSKEERTSKLQADKARLQAEIAALQELTSTQIELLTKVENSKQVAVNRLQKLIIVQQAQIEKLELAS
jgi:chromosome segregation ATPase